MTGQEYKSMLEAINTPADVQLSRRYPEGAVEYTIPKRWVRVNATRILSEAQREATLKNVKAARMAKLG